METGPPGYGQAISIEDGFDPGSLTIPRRRRLAGDFVQTGTIPTSQRPKRQNCGDGVQQEYHTMVFGNTDHSGPGSNIVTEGSTSQYGGSAMFPEGVNEQVNRSHARNYQAGHAPFNLHPHAPSHAGDESWSWSKGQISRDVGAVSSFLPHDGAAFDRGFARFTQGPPRMMRSFETSSVWDEARLSNDNHGNHRVWGLTSMHHFPSEGSGMNGFQARDQHQSGRDETNAVPSHAWSPGRYLGDEHMSEATRNRSRSIETVSGCNNGLHVTNNIWHESDSFRGASSCNPSTFFPGTRDLNSITDMGIRAPYFIHSRVQLPSGSACLHEPALQEPHHSNPSSYGNPGFQSSVLPPAPLTRQRPSPPPPLLAPPPPPPLSMLSNAHSQEGLCLIPPPASAATRSNFNFGLPPVHAAVGPRAVERTRTPSSRRVSFQASIPFPPRRSDHHQLVSLGFVDELSYNGIDWGEIYDEHRNMRMDVDSMSYEELLALGESIGHVNTGLSEDNIRTCLETIVCTGVELTSGEVNSQESDSKCSICQEEYINGGEVARLVCRHAYHTSCIKQWLFIKNQCPICKAAAHEDS